MPDPADPTVADVIIRVHARLSELRVDHEHLTRTARGIAAQLEAVNREISDLETARAVILRMSIPTDEGEPPVPTASIRPTIIDAAVAYLAEVGGEAHLRDMTIALIKRGNLRGEKPDRTLSTQLFRAAERPDAPVHKVGRGRWALGPEPAREPEAASPAWHSDVMDRLRRQPSEPTEPTEEELSDILPPMAGDTIDEPGWLPVGGPRED